MKIEIGDNFGFVLVILLIVVGGAVAEYFNDDKIESIQEKAVIIEVIKKSSFNKGNQTVKVKFEDSTSDIIRVHDGYCENDTILIYR